MSEDSGFTIARATVFNNNFSPQKQPPEVAPVARFLEYVRNTWATHE